MCLLSVWMKNRISFLEKPGNHYRCVLEITEKQIQNTSAVGHAVSLFSQNLWQIIAMLQYVNTGPEEAYELAKRLEIHYTPNYY